MGLMSMQEKNTTPETIEVGLSIGGNMGDRLAHLRNAVKAITQIPGIACVSVSPVYETEPVGVKPQYRDMPYLNAVVIITAAIPLPELSKTMHDIEEKLGRTRAEDRFAPRTIDIDILFAGETICQEEHLTLPHPRWAERRFVLQPLADLRPDLHIPGSNRSVAECLAALPTGKEAVHKLPDTLLP